MQIVDDKIITFLPWESIELEAQEQIRNTSQVPCLFKHVAVMPDCHFGKGATVGTVLATQNAIIPAAVGVDIGCGMIAVRTNLKREDIKDLVSIRTGIERRIPMSAGKFNNKITEVKEVELQADDIVIEANTYSGSKDKKSSDESIRVYGYQLTTEHPKFGEVTSVFSFRNYSNGYYGGWLQSCEDREVKPEIFNDIIESSPEEEEKE